MKEPTMIKQTLEQRISTVLTDDNSKSSVIGALIDETETAMGTIFVCLLPFFPFRGACRIAGVNLADSSRFCSSHLFDDLAGLFLKRVRSGVVPYGTAFKPRIRLSVARIEPGCGMMAALSP
jgi:hypothetical protein